MDYFASLVPQMKIRQLAKLMAPVGDMDKAEFAMGSAEIGAPQALDKAEISKRFYEESKGTFSPLQEAIGTAKYKVDLPGMDEGIYDQSGHILFPRGVIDPKVIERIKQMNELLRSQEEPEE